MAGKALNDLDPVVGKLGKPLGVAVYRPLNSSGEDFLPVYIGEASPPVEMYPEFPKGAKTVLLTEAAKYDPLLTTGCRQHHQ